MHVLHCGSPSALFAWLEHWQDNSAASRWLAIALDCLVRREFTG